MHKHIHIRTHTYTHTQSLSSQGTETSQFSPAEPGSRCVRVCVCVVCACVYVSVCRLWGSTPPKKFSLREENILFGVSIKQKWFWGLRARSWIRWMAVKTTRARHGCNHPEMLKSLSRDQYCPWQQRDLCEQLNCRNTCVCRLELEHSTGAVVR